jgi:hypothetical protein
MKLLFPKQNYNVLSPSSYTHISVRDFQDQSVYSAAGTYSMWTDPGKISINMIFLAVQINA